MVRITFERMVAGTAVNAGEPVTTRRRSWRERLLSRPWRPWIKRTAARIDLEETYRDGGRDLGGVVYPHNMAPRP